MIVVVTTPIEEVGRDHDFDWAIADPNAVRSMIQLAGRVLRHRPDRTPAAPNLLLLPSTFRHYRFRRASKAEVMSGTMGSADLGGLEVFVFHIQ